MRKISYLVALIVIACLLSNVSQAQMRNFTGSNGRIIEAEFLGFNEATQIVNIRLRDGREQNVRLDLFSAACQQWIKSGGQQGDDPFGDAAAPLAEGGRAGDRKVLTIKNVEYAFRWCPPGTFMMGSPESEQGRQPNERQHQVTLTQGFWMLETEVTQAMWVSIMGNNPSEDTKVNRRPVETVSWNDCQEYIQKLNDLGVAPAGFKFSLPTEAQWEYACRAGTTTAFHFGNTLSREQANFNHHIGRTTEVGSYPANAWGLYDMHGNVMEWCLDWLGEYPRGAVTDPMGSPQNTVRGQRGGHWHEWGGTAANCRSAHRGSFAPTGAIHFVGFRFALVQTK